VALIVESSSAVLFESFSERIEATEYTRERFSQDLTYYAPGVAGSPFAI
jgi:hypothetical protein